MVKYTLTYINKISICSTGKLLSDEQISNQWGNSNHNEHIKNKRMYEEIFERKEQILSSHGQKTATQETLFIYRSG